MKFKAQIDIMPMEELLDPQGKVVTQSLHKLGLEKIDNVRIGKHINLSIEAGSESEAEASVKEACQKLLANLIMERYTIRIEKAE